jgi:hypothetical protein
MAEMNCAVCAVAHDPEIHEATERIHRWLRVSVEEKLRPIATPQAPEKLKKLPRKKAA